MIPFPSLMPLHVQGFWFIFLGFCKISVSIHHYFFQSSLTLIQTACLEGLCARGSKQFQRKTFLYNWTRKTSRSGIGQDKITNFQKNFKMGLHNLLPFHPDSLPSKQPRKAPFLRTAALNNQIALRCVQYEKVTEAESGLRSIVADSS